MERLGSLLEETSENHDGVNPLLYLGLFEAATYTLQAIVLTYTQCFKGRYLLKFLNQANIYSEKYPLKIEHENNNSLHRFVSLLNQFSFF